MHAPNAKLTIAGKTFTTGDRVMTPFGAGVVVSLDAFGDEEIMVQIDATRVFAWFSFHVVTVVCARQEAA